MIKPTGNKHFDRLYLIWVEYTKNTNAKHEALKVFTANTKRMSQPAIKELVDNIGNSIIRKNAERIKKQNNNEFVPEWCSLAVYLRQKRFDDDSLDSIDAKKEIERVIHMCEKHHDRPAVYAQAPYKCSYCVATQEDSMLYDEFRDFYKENGHGRAHV